MKGIQLAKKEEEEDHADDSFPVEEDDSLGDLGHNESFETVDVEEESPRAPADGFGQPLAVLALTDRVKRKVGGVKMPTMARAGNVYCFWHDSRGVPRITIGPSWPFAIVLVLYAVFLTVVHIKAFSELLRLAALGYYIVGVGLMLYSLGMWGLFYTFLGDPGIPEEIFLRYSDPSYSVEGPDDDEEEDPIGITPPTTDWCSKCLVPTNRSQVHCGVCNICIKDYDHHCIFFGKCIGGGNMRSFQTVIAMAVISTIYAGGMYGWFAIVSGPPDNGVVQQAPGGL